jgi:hypothetical protein
LFLLSAFFDARVYAFYSVPTITVLALIRTDSLSESVECVIAQSNYELIFIQAKIVQLPDHHDLLYRSAYIECNASQHFNTGNLKSHLDKVQSVTVKLASQQNKDEVQSNVKQYPGVPLEWNLENLPAAILLKKEDRSSETFGLCIAPIREDQYSESLNTYIAHYEDLIGSNLIFMVYNDSSSGPQTSSVLSSLARSKDRVVKIINWKLQSPNFPDLFKIFQQNGHENGQMLAVNDCLYRLAGVVDWVGVVDLDEYVVGKFTSSLRAIFNSTHPPPYTAAFQFRSASFNGTCKNNQNISQKYPLDSTFYRSEWFPENVRSKMFINPAFVHIAGIHYPHMFIDQHPS